MAEKVLFELNYPLPFNAFEPKVFAIAVGPALLLGVLTMSAWVGLVLLVLGCTLAYKVGSGKVGNARAVLVGDELRVEESPGMVRICPLAELDKVQPKERESIYEPETGFGLLVLIMSDGRHLRIPENRSLVVPYSQAEQAARQVLELLRSQARSDAKERSKAKKSSP